ncbi:MAG: RdgB/HAM1 family non-canonical purine NTP pyrophosphatase [Sphingobacteriales bacterium]|nr:RdgB/HAM1 family non-canonical purine NTP pyrophosphatase [Sphingobacteriales bacterium]MBI3720726.1 RdgB/HAM1 family non-canonical purine NTP pyrophosphatase [Sphingobacteriales bacterium]
MKLIFATNNQHKVEEIRAVLDDNFSILTLKEAGIDIDIPETHDTIEANASEKSSVIHQLTGKNCFSEDTGLECEVLNGAPGVKSARYAGEHKSFQDNIDLLQKNLSGKNNRKAQFKTIISLLLDNKEYLFEGICKGQIIEEQKGEGGFGYDPVFVPEGSTLTFAQMSMEEKSKISHRAKAVKKLVEFLNNYTPSTNN